MRKNEIRYVSLAVLFLLGLGACQSGTKYPDAQVFSFSDFKETRLLKGETVTFDDILWKPVKIHLVDSFLIMKNRNTELAYHIYNIMSRKKVGECVSFGLGPDEMIDPRFISSNDSSIWILDKNWQTLNMCDRRKFLEDNVMEINKKIDFRDFCDNIAYLPGKGFVASLFNADYKRFCLFNLNGDTLSTKGDYPESPALQTYLEKIEGFIGDFAVSEDGKKVLVSHKRTDLLEYYDADMNLIKRVHGPEQFFPGIHQAGERIETDKGATKDAYFFPLTVGENIFLLYSGRVFNPMHHNYLKERILVFDWDGNPQQCYQLDTPIFDFAVDKEAGIIYGLTDQPESHIVRFKF